MSATTAPRLISIALWAGALLACAAERPDLRTPNEIAAPSLEDWRAAAHGLADDIADDIAPDVAARSVLGPASLAPTPPSDLGPASLAPIEGSAPTFFRDLLLADLIENGVPIVEEDDAASLRIACRATPIDVLPNPRGPVTARPTHPGEMMVLCLIAHDGAYLAVEERSLSMPVRPEPSPKGIVIEVTG